MNFIYYFTGTGNSLYISKKIASFLPVYKIIRITSRNDFSVPISAERLGIVFPVYAWGLPNLVKNLISRITMVNSEYIFAVANYAGNAGAALHQAEGLFKQNGVNLNFSASIKMPNNYIIFSHPDKIEKAEKKINSAQTSINNAAVQIASKAQNKIKSTISGKLVTTFVHPLFTANIGKSDKAYFADDKCNHFAICKNLCPVDNIAIQEGKPVWQRKCEQCLACISWCPQKAIQFNKNSFSKDRYHNPKIGINELVESS
jgi:Fe-S-cluster-containing hydrogenase component 2